LIIKISIVVAVIVTSTAVKYNEQRSVKMEIFLFCEINIIYFKFNSDSNVYITDYSILRTFSIPDIINKDNVKNGGT